MNPTTFEVAEYLDEILLTSSVPDYPNAVNGLQLANSGRVTSIAAAVDFSSRTVARTVEAGANLMLVHHGMFWSGMRPVTGVVYARLRTLLDNDIAVYSSHLPLDRHPEFGNNVLLCEQLGLVPSGQFAEFKGSSIGVSGDADVTTDELVERARILARNNGGEVITTPFRTGRRTRQWGVCAGAGASAETLAEAAARGIDTLIVGEGPHWTAVEAADTGMAIIYAGHYATETLGVAALSRHLSDRFGLEWTMVHAPTGL